MISQMTFPEKGAGGVDGGGLLETELIFFLFLFLKSSDPRQSEGRGEGRTDEGGEGGGGLPLFHYVI